MSSLMAIGEQTITLEDIAAAAERIQVLARNTPLMTSRLFNEAAGRESYFKCENLQRGGSFKIRGAANFLLSLSEAERQRGVVAYSSGNHAQAIAIAAAYLKVAATIVMPSDVPKAKLQSTQAYGPEIVFYDRQRESREEIAQGIAETRGAAIVPPYDHPWIVAGQGTIALEMLQARPGMDAIAVCLGGGGMLSGICVAAKAIRPDIRIFGVEPELASDWYLSLAAGRPVQIDPPPTIADGLRTLVPGRVTFPIVRSLVEGVVLVSDDEIRETLRFLLTRMKILAEPSGAAAAAAVLFRKLPTNVRSTGITISGGNVDLDVLASICGGTS